MTNHTVADASTVDSGHTAYILVCIALVQLMLPGLAFFYAGLLKHDSVITMIMQNYAAMGVITIIWFLFGFSLCFGHSYGLWGSITTFGAFYNVEGTRWLAPILELIIQRIQAEKSWGTSPDSRSRLIKECLP